MGGRLAGNPTGHELDGLLVEDHRMGGAISIEDDWSGISGEMIHRMLLTVAGRTAWSVACRFGADPATATRLGMVCFLDPGDARRAPVRIALSASLAEPLRGVALAGGVPIARIGGGSDLPVDTSRARTTGYLLRAFGSDRDLAFVTSVDSVNAGYLAEDLGWDEQESIAAVMLVLASIPDIRLAHTELVVDEDGELRSVSRSVKTTFDLPGAIRALERGLPPALEDDGGQGQLDVLRRLGFAAEAEAIRKADEDRADWMDAPKEEATLFGPDVRDPLRPLLFTLDIPVGLTFGGPLDAGGGEPSVGLSLGLGVEAWDFLEVYGFLDGRAWHAFVQPFLRPSEEFQNSARLGLGARLNLLRVDEFRLFAGFETGWLIDGTRVVESGPTERDVARWEVWVAGPTVGMRVRLFENFDGRSLDLRLDGMAERAEYQVRQASEDYPGDIVRWGIGARLSLQVRI